MSAVERVEDAGERIAQQISDFVKDRLNGAVPDHELDPELGSYNDRPQWSIPCPRAIMVGDEPHNSHRNKGTAASYTEHTARLSFYNGQLQMRCFKCCDVNREGLSPEQYTQEVIADLGLEAGNIQGIGPRTETLRTHRYPIQGGTVLKSKTSKAQTRGRPVIGWRFEFEDEDGQRIRIVKDQHANGTTKRTAMDLFSATLPAVMGVYNAERIEQNPHATLVFCEGERDVDTAEALIHIAGQQEKYVATTSPVMTFGTEIPGRIRDPFHDRAVVTVFDNDLAGDGYRSTWPQILWDNASRWMDVVLPLRDTDLSDWADAYGNDDEATAAAFIEILDHAEVVTERPLPLNFWTLLPDMTQQNSPSQTSPFNGRHVLQHHPELKGRILRHGLSGQLLTVDVPFAEGVHVWPRWKNLTMRILELCREGGVSLSRTAIDEAVLGVTASEHPPYMPHAETLGIEWDGTSRAEALFTTYLPLRASAEQQRALSRLVLMDLARAMEGVPRSETSNFVAMTVPRHHAGLSVVDRMLPGYAASKVATRVNEKDVLALMRKEVALIQYPLKTIADFTQFSYSAPVLNAGSVEIDRAEYVGAPSFLFVGSDDTDLADLPPGTFIETLDADAMAAGLGDVMPQMLAETIERRHEWAHLPAPQTNETAKEASVFDKLGTIGTAVALYVFKQCSSTASMTDYLPYTSIMRAGDRTEPLAQVVTNDFLTVMNSYLREVYGAGRNDRKIQKELQALYNFVLDDGENKRRRIRPLSVSGVTLEAAGHFARLRFFLDAGESGDTDDNPENPGSLTSDPGSLRGHSLTPEVSEENQEVDGSCDTGTLDERTREEKNPGEYIISRVRVRDINKEGSGTALTPDQQDVAEILATPGTIGLDFETHPGAWAYWKSKMIHDGTWPKDPKLRAKMAQQNEFENAPPRRKPCILTVTHQDGRKKLLRLTGSLEARRAVLRNLFSHVAEGVTLAAHNAQFESEVLYAAGVEVEIECTMIASKLIYAEAYAWDEDDDDGPGFGDMFADPEEDIGLIDEHGVLDVSRVQPIGKLRRHSLKACMEREFGEVRDKTLRDIDWDSPASDSPEYRDYAQVDADDALRLWVFYRDAMHELGIWEGYRNLADAIPAVSEINTRGMVLNEAKYREFRKGLAATVEECDVQLRRIAPGVTIAKKNFNDAMRWWLLEQLWDGLLDASGDTGPRFAETRAEAEWDALEAGTKPPTTGTYWTSICNVVAEEGYELAMTRGTFDEETRHRTHGMGLDKGGRSKLLTFLSESGVAPRLLEFMVLYTKRNVPATLLANTAEAFHSMRDPVSGRITGNHQIAGAVTGRQNCSKVNLQQVPTEGMAREMFEAEKNRKFVIADYSQVELRVGAIIAEDEVLIDVYKRGVDVHTATAARCFHVTEEAVEYTQRRSAKAVNFGAFYGAAGPAIAASLGTTLSEGETLLGAFLEAYPGVAKYRERTSGETGPITILPGRRVMAVPELKGPKRTNYPIQGAAASVQHVALTLLFAEIRRRDWSNVVWLCAAVHDEIVVECPEAYAEDVAVMVKDVMSEALLQIMPDCIVMGRDRLVDANVGDSWREK